MAYDGSQDGSGERPIDARALRFTLIFPLLLAAALFLGGLLIRAQLPHGVVLPTGGEPIPVFSFLGVGAAVIVVLGVGVGGQGARTLLPSMVRRILLGVGMTLQLAAFTLFGAALLGQGAPAGSPKVTVDGFSLLMGCGLAMAMGVVLAMTFKPAEQWSASDDKVLAQMLDAEADPTAINDTMAYFVHPRGSVTLMILLVAILPGAILTVVSPWILLVAVVLALLAISMLSATIQVDRHQLSVKLLGLVPVMAVPCESVDASVSLDITAKDYGGWGLRKHSGSATFLTYSGAAVVLRLNDGGKVVVSAPDLDMADDLSAILNRRAGKSPDKH